jgi:hypothetical protein
MRAPWIEAVHPHRVVGVHRHVRVTLVGRDVGAWNGYTERLTAVDLRRLADWLEEAADGAASTLLLGRTGELREAARELRTELKAWLE